MQTYVHNPCGSEMQMIVLVLQSLTTNMQTKQYGRLATNSKLAPTKVQYTTLLARFDMMSHSFPVVFDSDDNESYDSFIPCQVNGSD
jgi:hypothetical protein